MSLVRWALAAVLACSSAHAAEEASLILRGGRVYLGPGRYAGGVAISGNRIVEVGEDADVLRFKGPSTRVIDLAGRALVPGFHDAHVNLMQGALSLIQVDLVGAASPEQARERVLAFAQEHVHDEWIVGRGWDDESWDGQALSREQLDIGLSTRPVALIDASGRKLWLNTAALQRAGMSLRDPRGRSTGVLTAGAMSSALKILPKTTREQKVDALRQAFKLARENGVTAFDSMPGPADKAEEIVELWRDLHRSGEDTARLTLFGRLQDVKGFAKLRASALDLPRTRLLFGGVAATLDGEWTDRGAALLEPYFDAPAERGQMVPLLGNLHPDIVAAHAQGFDVALQAVGDRAVRKALEFCARARAKAREEGLVLPEAPCRIERADAVAFDDLRRFAEPQACVVAQPSRLAPERAADNLVPSRLGERFQIPLASLEKAGVPVSFGSGWPAQPLSPLVALYGAVMRRSLDGKPAEGWAPRQRVSLESALDHMTSDPARLSSLGVQLGRVAPRQIADLVVLDRDVFSGSPEQLSEAAVDLTVFDGRVVFERSR